VRTLQVVKRNGKAEPFDFAKVKKVIEFACDENEEMVENFIHDLRLQLKDRMDTKDVQKSLIRLAVDKVSVEEPYWDKVASKLYLYDLIKRAGINREYRRYGYGNFYKLVKNLTHMGLYHADILKHYYKHEIMELGEYIKPENDNLLTYVGIKTLAERYLIRSKEGEYLELPQEAYMGVAMFLALAEKKEDKVYWAKKFYDVLSIINSTSATPTMTNARKPFNQLSSCFIGTMEDSLESIYHVTTSFANVSKFGGGMGVYIGKLRAENSDIRGFKNTSKGIVYWCKLLNDTSIACDQLGTRKGAIAITLDCWHRDIFTFLSLKTTNGDERLKAMDVFPSVSIPDLFMKQVKEKGDWYLFCPHEVETFMGYRIEDSWGEEFEKKYWDCVNHPLLPKKKVKAIEIMQQIIKSATETGNPFLFFRDTVNRMNPISQDGRIIYCSNLCHEICQNTSPQGEVVKYTRKDSKTGDEIIVEERKQGDFVVCNLASLVLDRIDSHEKIKEVVPVVVRMMDNVIDLNYYPVEEARNTNKRYRSLGLGAFGYHAMLAKNKIKWESDEHLEYVDNIFEMINYYAIKASNELAVEKGKCQMSSGSEWENGEYFRKRDYTTGNKVGKEITLRMWKDLAEDCRKHGMRNAYLMAIAPNGSSSLYGGSTQSIDPIYQVLYYDEKKNQVVPIVAPYLSPQTMFYYKPAHAINQSWSIKANAVRQRHIDQSQSFNIYIRPEEDNLGMKILKMYFQAWSSGCKTIYYTRSMSLDVEDCVSCSG
jgi:ribonucleoside-diphosphate reductase alpha chain